MPPSPDASPPVPAALAEILAEADGDDEVIVRLCGQQIRVARAYQDGVRDVMEDAAARLRDRDVPMGRIARLAGVSDSYLSRRLITARGMARKVIRPQRRYR